MNHPTGLCQASWDALEEIRRLAGKGKKIVFVPGLFNIVHPGHLRLLKFAADLGDLLVVGVYSDAMEAALLDETMRLEGICAITWVDYAFTLNDPTSEFVRQLKPDVMVKGKEHENGYNAEEAILEEYGGKLIFNSGDMSFSLEELLEGNSKSIRPPGLLRHSSFMQRHGFNGHDLMATLDNFSRLNVMVIGDVIVDEYINCDPLGMSQEDPTIVVTPVMSDLFVGGAGIVAAHARNLGADVTFFSVTGEDEAGEFARKNLKKYGVNTFLCRDESRPTTLKQRFKTSNKTLLRVNHLRQHPVAKALQKEMADAIRQHLDDTDLVIFSDFNYGAMPQPLVESITKECREKGIMMVADSQSSSQVGDVSRFCHMKLLTPTEREARLALRDFSSGLVVLAEKLKKKAVAENVFITLDKEGLLIQPGLKGANKWQTDRMPAMNPTPKDPAGAGDSLLTCAAMALASGSDIWTSAYLGSLAAACQIGRVGNIPLAVADMQAELNREYEC